MLKKRKICVVITARPSYSRVKTALLAIKNHKNLELQLVLSGSALLKRYGDVAKVIEDDGFKITASAYNSVEGDGISAMAKTTGITIVDLSMVFESIKPDIVVTIADRYETIATSIAAAYQNIPLAHIQGGEVTGNIDEKVRHANTKLADIHLVASNDAKQRVIKLGENPAMVVNTGCPSIDLAREVSASPNLDFDPILKYGGVGSNLKWRDGYVVVMQHSVTTEIDKSREDIKKTMDVIIDLKIPVFWFWPNIDAGSDSVSNLIRQYREDKAVKNIHFFKNMRPHDFLKLLKNSKCLIGNSSVGLRECAFLGVPVVNIGSRQHGRQRGVNVMDCKNNKLEIKKCILEQINHDHYQSENIYGDGFSGDRIASFLNKCDLISHKTITY
jgi:UDP-hydrolysing UDP-N-acetyl-D-glucosamine 2-epimerase